MYRKFIVVTSAIALAMAITIAQPAPKAEAFFVLPIVAAAAMFGAFGAGGIFSSLTAPTGSVGNHTGCRTRSGSTFDPSTGAFTGEWATQTTCTH